MRRIGPGPKPRPANSRVLDAACRAAAPAYRGACGPVAAAATARGGFRGPGPDRPGLRRKTPRMAAETAPKVTSRLAGASSQGALAALRPGKGRRGESR